jgi:hypothetical protein
VGERVLSTTVKEPLSALNTSRQIGHFQMSKRTELHDVSSRIRGLLCSFKFQVRLKIATFWVMDGCCDYLEASGEISVTVVVREMPFHCGKVHC